MARPLPSPPPEARAASDVVVEYRGDSPTVLRGTASGRLYSFSPVRRVRSVPERDAVSVLDNPLFRLAQN